MHIALLAECTADKRPAWARKLFTITSNAKHNRSLAAKKSNMLPLTSYKQQGRKRVHIEFINHLIWDSAPGSPFVSEAELWNAGRICWWYLSALTFHVPEVQNPPVWHPGTITVFVVTKYILWHVDRVVLSGLKYRELYICTDLIQLPPQLPRSQFFPALCRFLKGTAQVAIEEINTLLCTFAAKKYAVSFLFSLLCVVNEGKERK